MSRGWAVAANLPIPLWGFMVVLLAPKSRLARYHGLQSGAWTMLATVVLAVFGFAADTRTPSGFRTLVDGASGLLLAITLGGLVYGAIGAGRGRYPRLRPAWDLLCYGKGSPMRTM